MKRIILILTGCLIINTSYGQDAKDYYAKGMTAIKEQKLDEAISFFDKSIELKKDEYVVWYNRGIVKSWQRKYKEAIVDFNQTIVLNPTYKKAYNSRANQKNDITDYDGALADYNAAIKLDSLYIDALYNRGVLLELLGKREEACKDFNVAYSLGDEQSKRKAEKCKEPAPTGIYSILRLTKTAADNKYGFSSDKPVKVGPGPDGGPANQRAYLNLLRDINGKPIEYKRVQSCCGYNSENGFLGVAMVDKYEIYYTNKQGEQAKAFVYISMYDYEEPQVLVGFKTVEK